jgi:hypothetical protein
MTIHGEGRCLHAAEKPTAANAEEESADNQNITDEEEEAVNDVLRRKTEHRRDGALQMASKKFKGSHRGT